MPRFLPVPWLRWKRFRVEGVVRERESGRPLSGYQVRAYDKDVLRDDFLGDATTDAAGRFAIDFTDARFKDLFESQPDLYLCVFAPGVAEPVHDTEYAIRENASQEETYEIEVDASAARSA
jgi:carotenoid cleavage dioxygenase